MSKNRRRVIAGLLGVVYAGIYGFWTMVATGGGHVNFIWFWLFITVAFFGSYFPLMAVLAVDLKPLVTKLIFVAFIGFYLVASTIAIVGWVNETATEGISDFSRAMRANGAEGILFCGALHFLPSLVFLFLLIKSIFFGSSVSDDETAVLDLT